MRIVEAVIVLPLTILIIAGLICLMMEFYDELGEQIAEHDRIRTEIYEEESVW